jgi:conjugal transfer pilus assembly protein TraI
LVIDRDLQTSAGRYGTPRLGSHLERYLVDALRQLVVSNAAWTPNAEKSRVWYGEDGLYIVWPNGANDLRKVLEADQLPGIPKSSETILEILMDAGVVEASGETQATWHIFPPHADKAIEAVRLASPSILLAAMEHPPERLPCVLAKPQPGSPAASTSARQQPESVGGDQFELPIASSSAAPACADPKPRWPLFSITAPLRLDARLRAALGEIVDSLNRDGTDAACCSTPTGLFIPLAEFERRAIEPTLAMRGLADASMLVPPSSKAKPLAWDFGGKASAGVVIDRRFIAGFGAANVEDSVTEGGGRAAP